MTAVLPVDWPGALRAKEFFLNSFSLLVGVGVLLASPAVAQHQDMPGMAMPAKPPVNKAPATKKVPKKAASNKAAAKKRPVKAVAEPRKPTPDHSGHEGMAMPMAMPDASTPEREPMRMPIPAENGATPTKDRPAMPMAGMEHSGHAMVMTGALGPYPMERESSGTSWQPDTSEHSGLHVTSGDWTLMAHGVVNLVYDDQSGPRGDDKTFVSGMLMGMARRPIANGTLQLKAMLSPDPLMGPTGYPLLLASGETANGRDRLIDRQHPHDLFMELSVSVSQNIGSKSSAFLYAGLPGEPAFGPPAFMHREAIMDSPEAPISHHWLDSTHISFGVLSAGLVLDRVKIEASRFNAREPDQHRWNIETGPLDSTAIRVSWNPSRTLALQGSWGHFVDPEQLEPGVNQKRWSASALWANEIAPGWKLAGTLAWGRKTAVHRSDDAVAAEASLKNRGWTLFSRGEMTENRELVALAEHGPAYRVGKVSAGAVRDFRIADHWSLGAGGLFAVNFVPEALKALYGSDNPTGAMAFVRLKID